MKIKIPSSLWEHENLDMVVFSDKIRKTSLDGTDTALRIMIYKKITNRLPQKVSNLYRSSRISGQRDYYSLRIE